MGFKAVSNHFGSFLEVTMGNSYGDYRVDLNLALYQARGAQQD